MEPIDLMYYTITAGVIVFIVTMIFVIYQLSILFALVKTLIWQIQKFPMIAAGTIQAGLLSIVLKLFKKR